MSGRCRSAMRVLLSATVSTVPRCLHRTTNLVGEMMMAPTWCFLSGSSRRKSFSTTGIKKDKVFPLPVTASTTTSLCAMNKGIAEAWTGVMRVKPIEATASSTHSDRAGVTPSHALAEVPGGGLGAIVSVAVSCSPSESQPGPRSMPNWVEDVAQIRRGISIFFLLIIFPYQKRGD